jgi:TonB family protein
MRTFAQWMTEYALNAAWQVPLLFAAAWFVARVGRRAGAAFEHRVWVSALLLETALPACTVSPAGVMRALAGLFAHGDAAQGARVTVTVGPGHVQGGLHLATGLVAVVAGMYACSLLYFAVRLGIGLGRTSLLRRRAELIALEGEASREYRLYARIFDVTNAVVGISHEIAGPVTIGVRQPMLLLPAGLDLDAQQEDLGAVFAHEFAHMNRKDFAKNLVYESLSLPIAFHPLLWMTRTRVAESREMVCDAMAADAVAGRQDYARSLLRLATNFSNRTQAATFHAIGIFDANHFSNFERRIMNLTERRMELRGVRRAAMVATGVVMGVGACASALALRVQVAAPVTATQNVAATQNATQSAMPQSFVLGVPRSETGTPAQTMKVEVVPSTTPEPQADASASPAPMPIRVLTPAYAEPSQPDEQVNDPARVSGGVMAGNILSKVTPVYPQAAKDAKVQGSVVLDAVIGTDGNIKSLRLVSGPEELTRSAWDAVSLWTYKPYLLNGVPTEVETTITVNYTLAQ